MYHVISLSSPDEIWKKLAQHVNFFNQIIIDLVQLDVKIKDEDRAIIPLCLLPSSYEHIVTTLTYGKETTSESRMQGRVLLKVTVYTLRVVRNVEESKRMMVLKSEISDQIQWVKVQFTATSVNNQVI